MRIFSSADKCRRVARRIFFTTSVAGSFSGTDFCLIFAPCEGYDEPEILPSSTHPICLMSADGGHPRQETAALRDFGPVFVRFGSFTTDAGEATGACMSPVARKRT